MDRYDPRWASMEGKGREVAGHVPCDWKTAECGGLSLGAVCLELQLRDGVVGTFVTSIHLRVHCVSCVDVPWRSRHYTTSGVLSYCTYYIAWVGNRMLV